MNDDNDDCSRAQEVITNDGGRTEELNEFSVADDVVDQQQSSTAIRFVDHVVDSPSGEIITTTTNTTSNAAENPSEPSAVEYTCTDDDNTEVVVVMNTPTNTDTTPYLEKCAETCESSLLMTGTQSNATTVDDGCEVEEEKTTPATATVERSLETGPDVVAVASPLVPSLQSLHNAKYTSLVMITQQRQQQQRDQPQDENEDEQKVNIVATNMTRVISSPSSAASAVDSTVVVVRHTNWQEADNNNSLAGYFTHALSEPIVDEEQHSQSSSSGSSTLERRRTVKITANVDYVAATAAAVANNSEEVSSSGACKSEVELCSDGAGAGVGVGHKTSFTTADESDNKSSVNGCVAEGGVGVEDVTVVTGGNTLSAVIDVFEDGLADDDSWVEGSGEDDDETGDVEDVVMIGRGRGMSEEDFGGSTTSSDSEMESSDDTPMMMCRAVDREEELRGYNRTAIDFTLHTIVEESCEDSEVEQSMTPSQTNQSNTKYRISESGLEKYFFGIAGESGNRQMNSFESQGREESMSETSSIVSEDMDSLNGPESHHGNEVAADLASSRLEKYFLSGFMGFSGERNDSDGSGSVGSDSEGRPSPEQRRKKLVRARGSGRSHSSSLDNLLSKEENNSGENATTAADANELNGDSSETDTCDEATINNNNSNGNLDKSESLSDTLKRKKQQQQQQQQKRGPSEKRDQFTDHHRLDSERDSEEGKKTPQPDYLLLPLPSSSSSSSLVHSRKQHSRDSGFIGSNDDLLQNQNNNNSNGESSSKDTRVKVGPGGDHRGE